MKQSKTSIKWFLSAEALESSPGRLLDRTSVAPAGEDSSASALEEDRYQKIALIGEGGMGRVWLGWDARIERHVAIKEPSLFMAERLRREVVMTARLDHPGIVAVHDIYQDGDGQTLFVMALVKGQTLAAHLSRIEGDASAQRERLVRHILSVCEIMGYVHGLGTLHRDLKPHNIIIEENGTTRLIDWGLAMSLEEASFAPAAAGTPGYMSPEQRQARPLDARSDVWSLGALLYTVLRGEVPPEDGHITNPEQPSPLWAICIKAMSEDPAARYQDAAEMARDLTRWFEGLRVDAFEMNSWQMLKWVVARHRRTILVTTLAMLLFSSLLTWSVLVARHEARQASLASEQLALQASVTALGAGDILESRAMLARAEQSTKSARSIGLRMQLELIGEPRYHHSLIRPPCQGKLVLTHDPEVQLCHIDARVIEAWSGHRRLWRTDAGAMMSAIHPDNHIKAWRLDEEQLILRASVFGALAIDLDSGAARILTSELVRFGSTQGIELLNVDDLSWLGEDTLPPCDERLLNAYRSSRGAAIYLCQNGEVWQRDAQGNTQLLTYGAHQYPHHYLYVQALDEHWFASSDGTIWPLGHYDRQVKLNAPLERIFAIPHTSYIVARAWGGSWRILDAHHGDWVANFAQGVEEMRATSSGMLQILSEQDLDVWQMPDSYMMRSYKGVHGFTDVAWSEDGRSLGATSAGSQVHRLFPFERRHIPPISLGRDVAKAITPWEQGFIAVHAMVSPDMPKGLLRYDEVDGELKARAIDPDARMQILGRRVESLEGGHLIGISIAKTLGMWRRDETRERFDRLDLSSQGPFLDVDVDSTRARGLAVGEHVLRFIEKDGSFKDRPRPEGAQYGALEVDGRYALLTRDRLLIFGAGGELLHGITTSYPTAVDWRTGHDQIVTGHLDGTVRVWDALQGTLIAEVTLHTGRVSSVAVSPGHDLVASASWDTTVRLLGFDSLDAHMNE